ncbi:hypothetical protein HGRIS_001523 [Hohenbuehelia grisea]|uniref:F-box domain-containing protein n=1 Tax=Hohenbuehelia grisea TaxID=104357 RepID=A0ABR3JRE0_9AGAR
MPLVMVSRTGPVAVKVRTSSALTMAQMANCPAPVSSIPVELLIHIFDIGQTASWQDEDEPPRFEVLVSHINRRWRNVALTTPTLWRRIDVIAGRCFVDEVAAYLKRSKPCPTDIRIDLAGGYFQRPSVPIPLPVIDLLAINISDCRRLTIISGTNAAHMPLLAHLKSNALPMPRLEHLSLSINDLAQPGAHSDAGDFGAQILLGGAPNLAFVRLRGLSAHFFRPPLGGVTTLHIDCTKIVQFHYSRVRDLLLHSPQLRNLSIFGSIIDPFKPHEPHAHLEPIHLPNLTSLRLCGTSTWVFDVALATISAPRLLSLVLKDIIENPRDAGWNTSSLGSSKFPMLVALEFYDFELTQPTYQCIFDVFPGITTFSIFQSTSQEPFILSLFIKAAQTLMIRQPWPALHTLALVYDVEQEDRVRAAVEARKVVTHHFRLLRLFTSEVSVTFDPPFAREVEIATTVAVWPDGLGYPDEEDFLFE